MDIAAVQRIVDNEMKRSCEANILERVATRRAYDSLQANELRLGSDLACSISPVVQLSALSSLLQTSQAIHSIHFSSLASLFQTLVAANTTTAYNGAAHGGCVVGYFSCSRARDKQDGCPPPTFFPAADANKLTR